MYSIIATGSKENAVIYGNSILVDCGISFSKINPFLSDLKLVLLTHEHNDHFKISTIKKMAFERPALRFGCGRFLAEKLTGIKNIDVLEAGKIYDYGKFKISPVVLYHDVENFGYRIFIDGEKIFHATDSAHLKVIVSKNYDLYAIESNYDEDTVWQHIEEKEKIGEFAHQRGSINSHLSIQQAQDFVIQNAGEKYEFITLHQSKEF
jgi:L-ascorbate metabolism protein UlaG (beta-lactamase superfamily)